MFLSLPVGKGLVVVGPFIEFGLSAGVIAVAGIFLTKSTDAIGELAKIGRLFAGSIFLAGATSLPELLVDISAVRNEMSDLAVGDLMGSSLINLLILAIADLLHHNPNKIFSRAGARHALAAAVSINLCVLVCIAIFLGKELERFSVGGVGLGPISVGLAYFLSLRLVYRDQIITASASSLDTNQERSMSLLGALSMYLASAAAIFISAPFLASSAGTIAHTTGLGSTFVGTALVAFCTSLPEVISTIAAVRMGAFDLAVGNIFGSNSFNMILLIPLDLFHAGNLLGSISRIHIFSGLVVILTTSVVVMGQLYQVEHRRKFIEPDAFAVIVLVVGALFAIYRLGAG